MENSHAGTGPRDLAVYYCGSYDCKPGLSWGPGIRDHYIIHLVLKGRGRLVVDGRQFDIGKGQGFIIKPDEVAFYQSDGTAPWTYAWVGFNGEKALSLLQNANLAGTVVFPFVSEKHVEKLLLQMNEESASIPSRDARLTGFLYLLFSTLIDMEQDLGAQWQNGNLTSVYTGKAIDYIHKNYSRKISVTEIADYLGVDRRYLHRFFKKQTNQSPQEYIINYRIDKACELADHKNLSIADISRSVGYEDQFLFSKMFHKRKGISPQNFRKTAEAANRP